MKKLNVKAMCVLLSVAMCIQTFSIVTFAQEPVNARSLNTLKHRRLRWKR